MRRPICSVMCSLAGWPGLSIPALAAAPVVASALEARTGRDADLAGFQLTAHAWMARFRQV
jgi:hypothetical protein